jgi:hypothetical protein
VALTLPSNLDAPPAPTIAKGQVELWELFALAALLAVYFVTIMTVGDQGTSLVNLVGPIVFGAVLLCGAVPSVMRDPNLIWTPLFWFRVASVAYFGFGNVVIYFLNPTSQASFESFFAQYLDLITKLNAVTTLGAFMTLGAAYVVYRVFQQPNGVNAALPASRVVGPLVKEPGQLVAIGCIFLAIGYFVKIVFVLPAAMGVSSIVLPNALSSLSLLSDAGIYMVAVWAWHYRPAALAIPFILTFVNIGLGLLLFSKGEVLTPILVMSLAWLSKGVTVRRLAVIMFVIFMTFFSVLPFTTSGRAELERRYGGLEGGGFAEHVEIASNYSLGAKSNSEQESGLMRFSYAACGTLALSLYDSGHPGGTLATLPAAFVPRTLWPDKPNMTDIGQEFNYIATGNTDSSSSTGWMPEAYWDYGWLGLPLIFIPIGVILQIWSSFSVSVMQSGRWIYFPFCLLGMRVGTRVDGQVVPDLAGPTILAIIGFFAVKVALQIYKRTNGHIAPVVEIRS